MASLEPQQEPEQLQGQERAFGWIVDGAKVVDDLAAMAANPALAKDVRHDYKLLARGAQLAVDAMEKAAVAGLPRHR